MFKTAFIYLFIHLKYYILYVFSNQKKKNQHKIQV